MSYTISELNGVKIYNFAAGKTLPQFLEEARKQHSSLRYNSEFRNRIELIQDFGFPAACSQLAVSSDASYIASCGVYPPSLKIFETAELSCKCQRGLDSEVVKFCFLSENYSKLALACADRNIELHA